MHFVGGDERRAAIDAAKHKKITRQGNDIFRRAARLPAAIVGLDDEKILAGRGHGGRGIETESGKRSRMLAEIMSVHPDVSDGADTIELKKVTLRRP